MSVSNIDTARSHGQALLALAQLLDRVENSQAGFHADQYQVIVARLKAALAEPAPQEVLQAVFKVSPSAAVLYENMHYELAGLSRSSLERSVESERLARQEITRISLSSGL
ncbi:MAG: hypothetical protein RL375_4192 [Pseudomonadota bacterium]|jgi:23S rRNA G2069 N7-methylase RlmK/C1962 C5-methylase RlmI